MTKIKIYQLIEKLEDLFDEEFGFTYIHSIDKPLKVKIELWSDSSDEELECEFSKFYFKDLIVEVEFPSSDSLARPVYEEDIFELVSKYVYSTDEAKEQE